MLLVSVFIVFLIISQQTNWSFTTPSYLTKLQCRRLLFGSKFLLNVSQHPPIIESTSTDGFFTFQFKTKGGNQTLAARARAAGLEEAALSILNGHGE